MTAPRYCTPEDIFDEDGNVLRAEPWAIEAGLMVEAPVKVRFSDGHVEDHMQVLITPLGLKVLAKEFNRIH